MLSYVILGLNMIYAWLKIKQRTCENSKGQARTGFNIINIFAKGQGCHRSLRVCQDELISKGSHWIAAFGMALPVSLGLPGFVIMYQNEVFIDK